MDDLLGTTPGVFIGLTVILVGGAVVLAGRAIAGNWKPAWQVVAAAFGLALADRFLVYALFEGPLLHVVGFLVAFAVLAGFGLLAWRATGVALMVRQYPWRYRRRGLLAYEEKPR